MEKERALCHADPGVVTGQHQSSGGMNLTNTRSTVM